MASKNKQHCKYGRKCYRKNPEHFRDYEHSDSDEDQIEPPKTKAKVALSPKEKKRVVEAKHTSPKKQVKTTVGDFFKPTKQNNDEGANSKSPKKSPTTNKEATENDDEEIESDPADDIKDWPDDIRSSIALRYNMEMPDDFYDFWNFAEQLKAYNPADAFQRSLGLRLVGPFEVLAGKVTSKCRNDYRLHYRFFYDPPEFQTVAISNDEKQFHLGYYRDDPSELPGFVAANCAADNGTIREKGQNLFAAFKWVIDDQIKKGSKNKQKLSALSEKLCDFAKEKGHKLDLRTPSMKARDKKVVCKTFHGAGVVVPVDENDVGYREVPETTGDLKKMFKNIVDAKDDAARNKALDPLMELVMLCQFANDEGDYGEALELGLDLFTYGSDVLHPQVSSLLPLAYELLGRQEYAAITKAHLRRRSRAFSQLDRFSK